MSRARSLTVEGLPEPVSHYADVVRFGDLLYLSGIVAMDAGGKVVGKGDPVTQAERIFESMRLVLDAVGATPADVLKVTIFMRDVADRPRINPVRQRFFGRHRPASTLVEVSRLVHDDLLLEVEVVAGIPSGDDRP